MRSTKTLILEQKMLTINPCKFTIKLCITRVIIICCNPQTDSVIYVTEVLRRIIIRKPEKKDFGIVTAEKERENMGQKIKQDDVIMIGKNIRDIRVKKRITQEEVAERLLVYGIKISRGTYSKIEMGIRNIEATSLEAIKNILDTTYERLFEHTK